MADAANSREIKVEDGNVLAQLSKRDNEVHSQYLDSQVEDLDDDYDDNGH